MRTRRYICVTDLEATCWDEPEQPGECGKTMVEPRSEIIEIGCVMVESDRMVTVGEFQTLIKPKLNPVLSDFCKGLTNISQEMVDGGTSFEWACEGLSVWLRKWGVVDITFASWGYYDFKQLSLDCELHGVEFPFTGEHLNVKTHFSEKKGFAKGKGQGKAANILGIEWEGAQHRALDDARMAAKVLIKVGL